MTDEIGHVKNPLTIIAIFAGLAEVGGTIVLPLLESNTQETYVWFLMLFPTALVAVFFFVLYKKHEVLYAPSDYRDDSTFRDIVQGRIKAGRVEEIDRHGIESARSAEGAERVHKAAADAVSKLSFEEISEYGRKVLKTLWKFQNEQFPNDETRRWGFGVALGATEYEQYRAGVEDLKKYGLVGIDQRGLCYLTKEGFSYCRKHDKSIDEQTQYWSTFSN